MTLPSDHPRQFARHSGSTVCPRILWCDAAQRAWQAFVDFDRPRAIWNTGLDGRRRVLRLSCLLQLEHPSTRCLPVFRCPPLSSPSPSDLAAYDRYAELLARPQSEWRRPRGLACFMAQFHVLTCSFYPQTDARYFLPRFHGERKSLRWVHGMAVEHQNSRVHCDFSLAYLRGEHVDSFAAPSEELRELSIEERDAVVFGPRSRPATAARTPSPTAPAADDVLRDPSVLFLLGDLL